MKLFKGKKGRKRRNTLIPFLLGSILLHILILLLISSYPLYFHEVAKKDKPKLIEITEIPVPKETSPPKETKRLAERSHTAKEEKTKDEFTKLGNPMPPERKPDQKQAERTEKQKQLPQDKPKRKEVEKTSPQIASLPKEIKKPEEPSKTTETLERITKDKLFSLSPNQIPGNNTQSFLGSRDVNKKEDTVDLSTTEFKYLSYFLKIKRQIEGVWNYPEISRLRGEQGELFLIFTIRKDGQLEDIKLINSSGYSRLDEEAIRAIKVASPFSPFPESWGLERLNIRAVFRYEIRYGWKVY
ncbi:MAG: protein TonB [Deltaproteobacteria bacterium]|nr:MAG: protein TonB [Deltaproteobacteria bacterium]